MQKLFEILKINDGYTTIKKNDNLHEAKYLKLDCSKARNELKWQAKYNVEQTLEKIAKWYQAYQNGEDTKKVCLAEIKDYEKGGI